MRWHSEANTFKKKSWVFYLQRVFKILIILVGSLNCSLHDTINLYNEFYLKNKKNKKNKKPNKPKQKRQNKSWF